MIWPKSSERVPKTKLTVNSPTMTECWHVIEGDSAQRSDALRIVE
jgi:hypothetical protein